MFDALRQRWKARTQAWVLARQGRDGERVEVQRGRIYIVPSPFGLLYAVLVFGMLMGALNYSNSMTFMLTFLLGALFLLAMHHAHRNLLGLVVERGRIEPPFAGQQAEFSLRIVNPSAQTRWAVGTDDGETPSWFADVPATGATTLPILVSAPRRGLLQVPRTRLYTRFPFGLFHAWVALHMDLRVVVYPAPAKDAPSPPLGAGDGRGALEARGQDDFAGLKDYRGGESPRHIAWKAYARGQPLMVKEFSGALQASQWFEFDALDGLDEEQRLSVMCRWVLDAERDALRYGLRLPGTEIAPGQGDAHRAKCLTALAMFGNAP